MGVAFLLGDLSGDHGVAFLEPGKDLDVDAVGDAGGYFPALRLVAGTEHAHELLAVAGLDGDHGDEQGVLDVRHGDHVLGGHADAQRAFLVVDKRFAVIVYSIVR